MADETPGATRSVERAVAVIRAIADAGRAGSRLTDIAGATGLSKATVHRLLATLSGLGWVEQDRSTSTYVLGLPLVGIGMAASDRHGFTILAAPHLNRIAEKTGDTVYLTVKTTGSRAVCVDRVTGSYPIRTVTTQIGERRALGSCAGSLALLAWAHEEEIEQLLASIPDTPLSKGLLLEPAALTALIRRARAAGFAEAPTTLVPGVDGVGIPVFGATGTAIAAFSVEAVSVRLSEPRRSQVTEWVKREAAAFARRLRQIDGAADEGTVRRLLPPGTA